MGAGRAIGVAVVMAAAVVPGPRASGATVWEPIARLSLEGGYDSNALYLGQGSDRTGRVSPELGVQLRNRRWELLTVYGADYLVYDRLAPGGIWNHRGRLELEAELSRRTTLEGDARGGYAYDPVGLALMGIFRTGKESAWTLSARGRGEHRVTERIDAAVTLREQVVRFQDGTGGAMHAPGAEVLWRTTRRLSLGGGYALGVFQGFERTGTDVAFSNGLRARLRYRVSRRLQVDAHAGPAIWNGTAQRFAFVPEAGAQAEWTSRWWDLRVGANHGLGLGSTARPGLVNSLEAAGVRRFGRRFDVRGDAGFWHSGEVPSGRNAVLGYALGGEAGTRFGGGLRLAVAATHYARLDADAANLSRTTVGLRVGWTWEAR